MNTPALTVNLTPADYALAERHIAESLRRQGRWYWPVRVIGMAIGLLAVLGFVGLFTFEPQPVSAAAAQVRNSALFLLAASALIPVAAALHKRSVAAVLFSPGSKLLKPYTLSLTSTGLELQSASGVAEVPWSAVAKVELEGDQLFLFTQPNYAVVVPAHAFSTRAELQAFAEELAAAKARHAACPGAQPDPLRQAA